MFKEVDININNINQENLNKEFTIFKEVKHYLKGDKIGLNPDINFYHNFTLKENKQSLKDILNNILKDKKIINHYFNIENDVLNLKVIKTLTIERNKHYNINADIEINYTFNLKEVILK